MTEQRCPRCGKAMPGARVGAPQSFPFCSQRCKLIDLDQWLTEEHRISSPLPEDADEEAGPEGDDPSSDPDAP